ncbi:PREDICTED: toll-like receptor 2 type-2 [Gavialis gangeticus]|uniref:toll-like receptor 2 type-2 n=1 Tax=Gavialis gangeticus TaxID=94835 RepID=UPI00092F7B20|nr:PREDICTED: toll-like receptor 2 type-2 [Gavialis gangeticus]
MTENIWRIWIIYTVIAAKVSEERAVKQVCPSCDAAHFCDCSFLGLNTIPSGLTSEITGLNLAHNKIKHISENDLRSGLNLRVLLLQSNQIWTIDENSFHSLGKLEHLDLSNNNMTRLSPTWFRGFVSLQHLDIRGNFYAELGEGYLFSNLKNLRNLYLGNKDRFLAIRQQDFEGITVLEQLEIQGEKLHWYEQGSLKSIRNINHIIINVRNISVLSAILGDLVNSVTCLELRNIAFRTDNETMLLNIMIPSVMKKLRFKNVLLTDQSIPSIMGIMVNMRQLVELEAEDCTLQGTGQWSEQIPADKPNPVKVVTIRNLSIEKFYLFTDLNSMLNLIGNLTKVIVGNAKVFLVPCFISQHLHSLEYLDLSDNLLSDPALKYSACKGAWPVLNTLNLSQNSLSDIKMTGKSLAHLQKLAQLDISQNNFGQMPEVCEWPENLKYLNLSGTQIPKLTGCIPPTLEVLDVSSNNLIEFRIELPLLRELYIAQNKLKALPDATLLPAVAALTITRNKLNSFSKEEYESFKNMKRLEAGDNNFICSCEFLSFIQYEVGIANVLADWPENYICDSPSAVRGKQVEAAHLSLMECHQTLVVSLTCVLLLLLILLIVIVGYKLHAFWYMKMTWAWLQAKRKPQKVQTKDVCYDAFVSYSERDSEWVEELMVQELEQANPPLRLCLHKRDFVPGKWIIDNIIDSIEKSHKTLFVLSEHFVQSEWCKYELDFSHFRLFDENNDTTYLEWPLEEVQQQVFWSTLKEALMS